MEWLQTHAYLAAWLAPVVAVGVAIVQNRHKRLKGLDWSRLLIYFLFLISVAMMFTPTIDENTRSIARTLVFAGLGFLIADRKQR